MAFVVVVALMLLVVDRHLSRKHGCSCCCHNEDDREPIDFSPAIGFTLEPPEEEYEDGDQDVIGFRPSKENK